MTTEKPWQKPPFWATEHNKDEQRRRDHRRLRCLRAKLWQSKLKPDKVQAILVAIDKLERKLKLTPSRLRDL